MTGENPLDSRWGMVITDLALTGVLQLFANFLLGGLASRTNTRLSIPMLLFVGAGGHGY